MQHRLVRDLHDVRAEEEDVRVQAGAEADGGQDAEDDPVERERALLAQDVAHLEAGVEGGKAGLLEAQHRLHQGPGQARQRGRGRSDVGIEPVDVAARIDLADHLAIDAHAGFADTLEDADQIRSRGSLKCASTSLGSN